MQFWSINSQDKVGNTDTCSPPHPPPFPSQKVCCRESVPPLPKGGKPITQCCLNFFDCQRRKPAFSQDCTRRLALKTRNHYCAQTKDDNTPSPIFFQYMCYFCTYVYIKLLCPCLGKTVKTLCEHCACTETMHQHQRCPVAL